MGTVLPNPVVAPMNRSSHVPFALVLSGGGARGFAHVGVLRVLEALGYRPAGIVGVSMGAVVGVTYASRSDWYEALISMDTEGFPHPVEPPSPERASLAKKVRRALSYVRAAEDLVFSWGPGTRAADDGRALLNDLFGSSRLEELEIPVAVCATDLRSGERVVMRWGEAGSAVYASAALAGVLPPLTHDGRILADGAYTDIAPVDVAREMDVSTVIAVDPGQLMPSPSIGNGLQAVVRAMEICHRKHADLRFEDADLVIRPEFRRPVDTLEFESYRECVAAGARATRSLRSSLEEVLGTASPARV